MLLWSIGNIIMNLRSNHLPGFFSAALLGLLLLQASLLGSNTRPRLLVTTDIGGDPDDQQSLIRLLVHSYQFELEGIITSASGVPKQHKKAFTRPDLVLDIIDDYASVYSNLQQFNDAYPSPEYLRRIVKSGNPQRGLESIGKDKQTAGSNWIAGKIVEN